MGHPVDEARNEGGQTRNFLLPSLIGDALALVPKLMKAEPHLASCGEALPSFIFLESEHIIRGRREGSSQGSMTASPSAVSLSAHPFQTVFLRHSNAFEAAET